MLMVLCLLVGAVGDADYLQKCVTVVRRQHGHLVGGEQGVRFLGA